MKLFYSINSTCATETNKKYGKHHQFLILEFDRIFAFNCVFKMKRNAISIDQGLIQRLLANGLLLLLLAAAAIFNFLQLLLLASMISKA